jgi:hypothetical protein
VRVGTRPTQAPVVGHFKEPQVLQFGLEIVAHLLSRDPVFGDKPSREGVPAIDIHIMDVYTCSNREKG